MHQDLYFLISIIIVTGGFIFVKIYDESSEFDRYFKNPLVKLFLSNKSKEHEKFILSKYQHIKNISVAIAVFGIILLLVNLANPSLKNKNLNIISVLCLSIVVILSIVVLILCFSIGLRELETDINGNKTPVFKLTVIIYIPLIFSILGLLLVFKLINQILNIGNKVK